MKLCTEQRKKSCLLKLSITFIWRYKSVMVCQNITHGGFASLGVSSKCFFCINAIFACVTTIHLSCLVLLCNGFLLKPSSQSRGKMFVSEVKYNETKRHWPSMSHWNINGDIVHEESLPLSLSLFLWPHMISLVVLQRKTNIRTALFPLSDSHAHHYLEIARRKTKICVLGLLSYVENQTLTMGFGERKKK